MDDRQTKIVEGAGLQESRLNQDFIDWLNRWGTPILLVVLLIAATWAGWTYFERRAAQATDLAFFEYEQARVSGQPEVLLEVARVHSGRGAVGHLATLAAADVYLAAVRRGVVPGGEFANPEDHLDEAGRGEHLDRAGELYERVWRRTRADSGEVVHAIGARWGMVAVAITRREFDEAGAMIEEIREMATRHGRTDLRRQAETRLAQLDELRTLPPLLTEEQIATAGAFPEAEDPLREFLRMQEEGDLDATDLFGTDLDEILRRVREAEEPAPAPAPSPTEPPQEPTPEEAPEPDQE